MLIGGSSRTTFPYVPAVSTITPRSRHPAAIAFIVAASSGSFVARSETSSSAHIAPRPRTSPTTSNRSAIEANRAMTVSPISRARASRSSRSILSSTARAAAAAIGFPP